jgi:hypothetical protein
MQQQIQCSIYVFDIIKNHIEPNTIYDLVRFENNNTNTIIGFEIYVFEKELYKYSSYRVFL